MNRGLAYDSAEGRAYAAATDGAHDRRGVSPVGGHRARPRRPVQRLSRQRGPVPARHPQASRRRLRICRWSSRRGRWSIRPGRSGTRRSSWARSTATATPRSSVLAPTGTIAFMMDCDTTGIEPDIALDQVQEARRRGLPEDRQQTVPARPARLGYSPDEVVAIVALHQRARDDRGRPRPAARAPDGVRLRLQARQRRALHPSHGPRPDDGCGPAVPLGRHQQDRQHARGGHRRRRSRTSTSRAGSWASRPSRSIATGSKRSQPLSTGKKKDSDAATNTHHGGAMRRRLRSLGSPSRTGAACPTSAAR